MGSRFVSAGLALAACMGVSPVEPPLLGEGTRVLFVGNSHTYVNDVPGILQALADSAGGEKLAVRSIAAANYALIDHWNDGIARSHITQGQWKLVVLQQGWTPAGVCRDTLRLATQRFSVGIKEIGATPTLYQVWPPSNRRDQFPGTIESYRLATEDVGGLLLPVAEAWQEVRNRDATVSLYADGLHANAAGSYLVALVMYARILQKTPVGLPTRVRTRSGVQISIPASLAALLQQVAADIGLAPTLPTAPTAQPVITSVC